MPWLLRMTSWVALLMMPAILYLSWRSYTVIRNYLTDERGWAVAGPLLLFSFYLLPASGLIDFYISGGIDLLKYPKAVSYWFWYGFVVSFQLFTWILIADVVKFLIRYFIGDKRFPGRRYAQIIMGIFAVVTLFTGWKMYRDTTAIITEEVTVEIENLPAGLEDFKVLHISDVQGDEYTGADNIARYVRKINQQKPDLVIFTGDLISYGTDFIRMAAREMGKIQATYGTVAVVGDHDYWAGVPEVEKALSTEDIRLLQDENLSLELGGNDSLLVTGVTEVYSKPSNPQEVERLMSGNRGYDLKVLASHQVADHLVHSAKTFDYDMMLAGHTHGGQVRVPFFGMNFSASEMETIFISGPYREDGLLINVNNGLGFTLAPVRYNAAPAISVITLQGKGSG